MVRVQATEDHHDRNFVRVPMPKKPQKMDVYQVTFLKD